MESVNLAGYIDHTLLKADATAPGIEKLCREAVEHGFYSVCVNGVWVPYCKELLKGSQVKISVVCGFPLGANTSRAKAAEAADAVEQGANEIDMVLQIGQLLEGRLDLVEDDIRQVVKAVEGSAIVKVIFETGFLNDKQKEAACRISEQAGAHYVKTSTGFGPGGATVEDIRLMRASVSPHIGVKASGGVRDRAAALLMIEAGATRLGTSSGVAIVSGTAGGSGY
ncbi:deoxyribose-phosphate aldolase [Paenibacillus sp. YN15]|uniref:deoxyribose-phosphate aldolase n=1 Tax=Paenibacillus sp. YN15 TaxID=1742774 RepID=UPI000DCC3733|nr:deoxyribose-phosphate aldolase [Paenibacillus sp. YN15]RAU94205.1 deoxyribose-phosphate aldolase [Paenibacillus sp. YN15]